MRKISWRSLLACFVVLVCFVIIHNAHDTSSLQKDSRRDDLFRGQRLLCRYERDPMMVDSAVLRHVTEAFDSITSIRSLETTQTQAQAQGLRTTVREYLHSYPLHIVVETTAKAQNGRGVVDQSVKDAYYIRESEGPTIE